MTAEEIVKLFLVVYNKNKKYAVRRYNDYIVVYKDDIYPFSYLLKKMYEQADLIINRRTGHICKNVRNFDPKSHKLAETLFR